MLMFVPKLKYHPRYGQLFWSAGRATMKSEFRCGKRPRLLFLVHREELLRQARDRFRYVQRGESFGDLLGSSESHRIRRILGYAIEIALVACVWRATWPLLFPLQVGGEQPPVLATGVGEPG